MRGIDILMSYDYILQVSNVYSNLDEYISIRHYAIIIIISSSIMLLSFTIKPDSVVSSIFMVVSNLLTSILLIIYATFGFEFNTTNASSFNNFVYSLLHLIIAILKIIEIIRSYKYDIKIVNNREIYIEKNGKMPNDTGEL